MPRYLLDARSATPHFPGIGRYVRSLATALVPLLTPDERLAVLTDPQQPLRLDGVQAIPVAASPFSLGQQLSIPALVRKLGTGLYHSPYYLMPYRPGAPTLLTVYDLIPLRYPEHSSARSRLLFRLTTRLALSAAQHVIAITETARREFIKEFRLPPARITAVPLAADCAFRPQPRAALTEVRASYNLPERFALYVGSNKPHKNLVGLVRAWAELMTSPSLRREAGGQEKCDSAVLAIAGAWDARYPEARQLAGSLHETSIRWLWRIEDKDLPALYSAATVFVFPSLFEGFGLPVLEAMACGTPVICSNVTALPEVAGEAALLIDPTNTGELAHALGRVLADGALLSELSEKGLERARRFSWQRTAAETLDLYRRLTQ